MCALSLCLFAGQKKQSVCGGFESTAVMSQGLMAGGRDDRDITWFRQGSVSVSVNHANGVYMKKPKSEQEQG